MGTLKPGATLALATRSSLSALVALALGLGLLTGCGSSESTAVTKSGPEILAAANDAARGASSVHVVARNSQGRLGLSLDVHLASNGGRGTLSFLKRKYEVIRIGDVIYLKGTKSFYVGLSHALGKPVHVAEGAWLKVPATIGPAAQLAAFVDLHGELGRLLASPGTVTKGASTTVNGQKAITLKQKTKVYDGSLFVAATGKPYPIEQVKHGEREQGRTTYSDWNQPVELSPPSPVVELGTSSP